MTPAIIPIVYHRSQGHTKQIAGIHFENLQTEHSLVNVIKVDKVDKGFELLLESDTIFFGCATYFGNISSGFKPFMELTEGVWYNKWAGLTGNSFHCILNKEWCCTA